jgi:hypothetical protein
MREGLDMDAIIFKSVIRHMDNFPFISSSDKGAYLWILA